VSAHDATRYCRWLSQQLKARGGRATLPDAALWEAATESGEDVSLEAACAGSPHVRRSTQSPAPIDDTGNRSNHWGVSDLFGNVWQWCTITTTRIVRRRPAFIAISAHDYIKTRVLSLDNAILGGGYLDDLAKIRLRLPASALADGDSTRHADLGFRVAGRIPFAALPGPLKEATGDFEELKGS
jgi:formylglycine-generating enzyme required for sulfatase activity